VYGHFFPAISNRPAPHAENCYADIERVKKVYYISLSKFADNCKICFDSTCIRGKSEKEKVVVNGGLLPIGPIQCKLKTLADRFGKTRL
jgi:hypothetical protein